MKITSPENAPKVPFDLEAYSLFKSPEAELIHMVLKPGEIIAQHSNPFKAVIFCIEGEVVAIVENETVALKQFNNVEIEKDLKRGIENRSDKRAILHILKIFEK